MDHLQYSYNLAKEYLHQEKYEEAKSLLEKVQKDIPNHPQIKWSLGLIHVLTGYPHQALMVWKGLTEEVVLGYSKSKAQVEQVLSLYEHLYGLYNQAISYGKSGKIEQAKEIYKQLLSYQKEIALPVEFYQGYILTSSLLGEGETIFQDFDSFPKYITSNSTVDELVRKLLKAHSIEEPTPQKVVEQSKQPTPKNRNTKKVFYGLGLVAAMLITGITVQSLNETHSNVALPVQPVVSNVDTSETNQYKERMSELEDEVKVLLEKQEALQAELGDKSQQLENHEKTQQILELANVDFKVITNQAALEAYKEGLHFYQNGQYDLAVTSLEQSQMVDSTQYYADDALFYLIQSKKKIDESNNLSELYDEFLENKENPFSLSPYYDDILLLKAEWLVNNNVGEGTQLLKQIQTEYPQEWTANRAKQILKGIEEDEDAIN
ncbi:tetratricopeptide repeat protein [Litchfieldia alkalitelluris]|uniref:tetratricopeptide repeat protein n=1 Tax=Litchfieldia alkalitelluris TaxID=304268 RepID=UPI000997CEE2|nr:tetratricopeptide repeat protein [Litchfieldia alkalitelluris]